MELKLVFDVLAALVIAYGVYAATSAVILYPVTNRTFWTSQKYWNSKYSSWRDVFRVRLTSLRQTRQMLATGYEQFSRAKQQFVLPQMGADPVLMVPKEQVQDMLSKLDSEHAFSVSIVELTAAKYTGDEDLLWDPHKTRAIKHRLNRRLPVVIDSLYAEIVKTFEAHWKTNGNEWTPQKVYPSCMDIVSRTANRVISGAELCRNYEFLTQSRRYTETKFGTAMFIRILPFWLRAIAGHAIAYPHKRILNKALVHVVPVIEERIRTQVGLSEEEKPQDVLQWLLEEKEPKLEDKDTIAKVSRHLLMLNSAAIHTTTISITNTIFDLFTSPRADEFVAALRQEIETVLAANNGEWTTKAVGELHLMDSTIKESMRMSPLGAFGLSRVVEDKNGVDFNGQHLPKGVRVAVAGMAIHRDPDVYADPNEFNAFRFMGHANSHITDTAATFLPFGHGRHSCPGRFFASMEMKLVFAHMLTTYDVRVIGPRPQNWEFAGSSTPLPKAECQIRPRQRV